jgi:hypothetical protein
MQKIFNKISRFIAGLIIISFSLNGFCAPLSHAQVAFLPAAGSMVDMTAKFNPVVIKGMQLHPDNPFNFDFIVDTGDLELSQEELKEQGQKLIGYFLASLTTPEKQMWVNLSPYEKDRIIPKTFGDTEMGKELLSQDYILKQIMATALYPERQLGREFWNKVYAQAQTKFGTTNVPVSTFNKVWILPDEALVYQNSKTNSVFVVKSSLKVMLEQDYLAMKKHDSVQETGSIGSQVIRDIVIPALTREVNEGRNFAPLRQVYQSLILAAWYKKNLHDNVIAQAYVDRNKIAGIDVQDKTITEQIYRQYLQAYRKGVYNYIKEEVDPATQTEVPRKYFSGGFSAAMLHLDQTANAAMAGQVLDKARPHLVDMAMRADLTGDGSGGNQGAVANTERRDDSVLESQLTLLEQIAFEVMARRDINEVKGLLNRITEMRENAERRFKEIYSAREKAKEEYEAAKSDFENQLKADELRRSMNGAEDFSSQLDKIREQRARIEARKPITTRLKEASANFRSKDDEKIKYLSFLRKITNLEEKLSSKITDIERSAERALRAQNITKRAYKRDVTDPIIALLGKDDREPEFAEFLSFLTKIMEKHLEFEKLIKTQGGQLPDAESSFADLLDQYQRGELELSDLSHKLKDRITGMRYLAKGKAVEESPVAPAPVAQRVKIAQTQPPRSTPVPAPASSKILPEAGVSNNGVKEFLTKVANALFDAETKLNEFKRSAYENSRKPGMPDYEVYMETERNRLQEIKTRGLAKDTKYDEFKRWYEETYPDDILWKVPEPFFPALLRNSSGAQEANERAVKSEIPVYQEYMDSIEGGIEVIQDAMDFITNGSGETTLSEQVYEHVIKSYQMPEYQEFVAGVKSRLQSLKVFMKQSQSKVTADNFDEFKGEFEKRFRTDFEDDRTVTEHFVKALEDAIIDQLSKSKPVEAKNKRHVVGGASGVVAAVIGAVFVWNALFGTIGSTPITSHPDVSVAQAQPVQPPDSKKVHTIAIASSADSLEAENLANELILSPHKLVDPYFDIALSEALAPPAKDTLTKNDEEIVAKGKVIHSRLATAEEAASVSLEVAAYDRQKAAEQVAVAMKKAPVPTAVASATPAVGAAAAAAPAAAGSPPNDLTGGKAVLISDLVAPEFNSAKVPSYGIQRYLMNTYHVNAQTSYQWIKDGKVTAYTKNGEKINVNLWQTKYLPTEAYLIVMAPQPNEPIIAAAPPPPPHKLAHGVKVAAGPAHVASSGALAYLPPDDLPLPPPPKKTGMQKAFDAFFGIKPYSQQNLGNTNSRWVWAGGENIYDAAFHKQHLDRNEVNRLIKQHKVQVVLGHIVTVHGKEVVLPGATYSQFYTAGYHPPSSYRIVGFVFTITTADSAMNGIKSNINGGIDMAQVKINAQGGSIRTAFSDPAQLQMLLNARGLIPVIYRIRRVTAPMISMWLA